ncbi:hypothetical protein CcaverHIS002_0608040 [Cutaneotrichosporon cavernicola]|uniref:F-box domain-containing protein n=1 Tax=Cutaneotrichosporon cavernicola TaxID=279322 RepID=A0AA48QYG8_9TREE|nr:uncharacterized protein CcaverHIS019_0607490 [Cutaneotrichosporon cavernicola]BEI86517.1 hypothetical protein CcaverHIS002_0608040 [Cutaneotrichosporon cavernicola]BEI94290.1 hypothetical protein CcaverHIS019_0607490 [Cutaneotrichosporon cavernicola]BEJ02067.1 hypothetical protein CcaverHIS631_0607490 [Cutaneotrichosporon cavernicola]BEJ09830.1 hypothetical protein CcaverHIS641_0607450 [Cutaneotrichosporon cavernicola]
MSLKRQRDESSPDPESPAAKLRRHRNELKAVLLWAGKRLPPSPTLLPLNPSPDSELSIPEIDMLSTTESSIPEIDTLSTTEPSIPEIDLLSTISLPEPPRLSPFPSEVLEIIIGYIPASDLPTVASVNSVFWAAAWSRVFEEALLLLSPDDQ